MLEIEAAGGACRIVWSYARLSFRGDGAPESNESRLVCAKLGLCGPLGGQMGSSMMMFSCNDVLEHSPRSDRALA